MSCNSLTVRLPFRDQTGVTNVTFGVSVSSGECPDPAENKHIDKGGNGGLACKQPEIFRLNNTRNVRWMKVYSSMIFSLLLFYLAPKSHKLRLVYIIFSEVDI